MDEFEIRGKKYKDRNGELFRIACRFRVTRDFSERKKIVAAYAKEVDRLIATGLWDYAPNFDEMLPNQYMPKSFYEYWKGQK